MSIKILATADMHLGKRSSGVPENETAGSPAHTWDLIVNWCLKNDVDVLALLGDIVEKDNRFFEAFQPLFNGFQKLREGGVKVFMISGNHDHDIPRQLDSAVELDNVKLIGRDGKWEAVTFVKGDLRLQFAGWSFPREHVRANPLLDFDSLSLDPGMPVIGLLHCDVNALNSSYAPVPLAGLISKQVDAWLLGHIHKPMALNASMPLVHYTGSPHAFSAKEPGEHGPLLVTINGKDDITAGTIPLSPIRYETICLDIAPGMQLPDFRTRLMHKLLQDVGARKSASVHLKYLIYDVELEGKHEHLPAIDQWISEARYSETEVSNDVQFSVRKFRSKLMPYIKNLEEYVSQNTPVGVLAETILAIRENRSTPLLGRLMNKWMKSYQDMHTTPIYAKLGMQLTDKDALTEMAKASILEECNRMISELLNQQKVRDQPV